MRKDISYIPTLMHAIHKKMMIEHEDILEKNDLSKRHLGFIFVTCSHKEGLTQNQICEKLRLDKGHVSRTLKDLEKKGFVEKVGEGSYKQQYIASEKAFHVQKLLKKTNNDILNKMYDHLTEDEIVMLESILKKIVDTL